VAIPRRGQVQHQAAFVMGGEEVPVGLLHRGLVAVVHQDEGPVCQEGAHQQEAEQLRAVVVGRIVEVDTDARRLRPQPREDRRVRLHAVVVGE
jgi:hypothetical protein